MESVLQHLANDKHPEQMLILVLVFAALGITIILLLLILWQVFNLYQQIVLEKTGKEANNPIADWFGQFYKQQAGLAPLATEQSLLLDHDYDGIKELDNHLPPWWKNLFYASIVFSVIYGFLYHWTGTWDLQKGEYQQEIAMAKVAKEEYEKTQVNSINELTAKFLTDASTIDEGKSLFTGKCVACHGAEAGGGVGPNLTDDYWLHGNKIGDVFKTVRDGVPGKGMTAWASSMNPKQIQAVSSYILSLKGTKPANAKEPQGTLVSNNSPTPKDSKTEEASNKTSETEKQKGNALSMN